MWIFSKCCRPHNFVLYGFQNFLEFFYAARQKSNAVRHYKFMLSWHSILCCSWQIWKWWLHFFVWTAAFLTVSFYIFLCRETNLLQDDINLCEFTANAAGHIILWTAAFLTVSFLLFLCKETIMLLMTLIHVNIQ